MRSVVSANRVGSMVIDSSTSGGDAPGGGVRPVGNRDTIELDPQADLSIPRRMTVPANLSRLAILQVVASGVATAGHFRQRSEW